MGMPPTTTVFVRRRTMAGRVSEFTIGSSLRDTGFAHGDGGREGRRLLAPRDRKESIASQVLGLSPGCDALAKEGPVRFSRTRRANLGGGRRRDGPKATSNDTNTDLSGGALATRGESRRFPDPLRRPADQYPVGYIDPAVQCHAGKTIGKPARQRDVARPASAGRMALLRRGPHAGADLPGDGHQPGEGRATPSRGARRRYRQDPRRREKRRPDRARAPPRRAVRARRGGRRAVARGRRASGRSCRPRGGDLSHRADAGRDRDRRRLGRNARPLRAGARRHQRVRARVGHLAPRRHDAFARRQPVRGRATNGRRFRGELLPADGAAAGGGRSDARGAVGRAGLERPAQAGTPRGSRAGERGRRERAGDAVPRRSVAASGARNADRRRRCRRPALPLPRCAGTRGRSSGPRSASSRSIWRIFAACRASSSLRAACARSVRFRPR